MRLLSLPDGSQVCIARGNPSVCGIALVNQREKAVAQNVRCHH
jgi:hypothetical protein